MTLLCKRCNRSQGVKNQRAQPRESGAVSACEELGTEIPARGAMVATQGLGTNGVFHTDQR